MLIQNNTNMMAQKTTCLKKIALAQSIMRKDTVEHREEVVVPGSPIFSDDVAGWIREVLSVVLFIHVEVGSSPCGTWSLA